MPTRFFVPTPRRLVVCSAATAVLALGLPAAAGAVVPWMSETVDAPGNTGQYAALAIGTAGSLHIAYHDVSTDVLRYAYNANTGGAWTLQTAASPSCGIYPSIAVDPFTNEPRITHEGSITTLAISSRKIAGVWTTQSFAGETTLNGSTATLLSPTGELDAAFQYMDYAQGFTGYPAMVRLNGSVWTPEIMGGGGPYSVVGGALSGANDNATGYQHFACDGAYVCCGKRLAHATRSGAFAYTWDYLTSPGTWPLATSIAVDASSQPQIAWISTTGSVSTSGPLLFTHKVGASWVTESVDGAPCNWPSVAIDPSGNIHIAYCNVGNGQLYYASRSPAGWWTTEVVSNAGETAQNASLALGPDGNPHIAWYDAAAGDLRHTWRNACTPPPSGLTAWWPFDEGSGNYATEVVGGNTVGFVSGSSWAPGLVSNAADFFLNNNYIFNYMSRATPAPGGFTDLGTGDLTICTWYKATDLSNANIRTLFDNRDQTLGAGITLFTLTGQLGFQLMTGVNNYANWLSPVTSMYDGQWHHLAATVQRYSPTGGHLYVDGQLTATFDPTAYTGNLNSSAAIKIGEEAFGRLDEMQLYKRALSANEVYDLYTAGGAGACKVFARVPSVTGICPSATTATVNLQVFNYSTSNKSFTWSMAGLPAVAPYNLAGPTTFAPPSGSTSTLAPYSSVNIPVVITKPFGLSGTAYAGYRATLTNIATYGQMWADGGLVSGGGLGCLTWEVGTIDLPWQQPASSFFTITNTSPSPRSYAVRVVESAVGESAGGGGGTTTTDLVALNGLPPGIPWEASYFVLPGASIEVPVQFSAVGFDPFRQTELQLRCDTDGDGIEDLASTLPVRQTTAGFTAVGSPGSAGDGRSVSLRALAGVSRGATVLAYSLPAAAIVSLDIVDASGRLARTLRRAPEAAGAHRVTWDGLNDGGHACAAGLYFARLRSADGAAASAKIVRVAP